MFFVSGCELEGFLEQLIEFNSLNTYNMKSLRLEKYF